MKRFLFVALGAFLYIALLFGYVALTVSSDLRAVTQVLQVETRDLEVEDVERAGLRLQRARERLDSLPARMLRVVPFVGSNLGALRNVVDASVPTLQAGLDLKEALDKVDRRGLVDNGRIRIESLRRLDTPVAIQVLTMSALVDRLENERDGSLAPPLWTEFDGMLDRARSLLESARGAEDLIGILSDLLGSDEERTYLVLLINNAELRGAGGILSGVGTIELDEGRLDLGKFQSVHNLRDHPPQPVPAPAEYERRYGAFDANTTLWLNASYSADVPDVALVASRLYRLKTGISTDGAIVIDPRGIQALLPQDASLEIEGVDDPIPAEGIADFIYSGAYSEFRDQVARRDAILALGTVAFERVLSDGLGSEEALVSLADAAGGGHIRFTSFRRNEARILEDVGIAGELELDDDEAKGLFVAGQNFGSDRDQGTKLDFWARRAIDHSCFVNDERVVCNTSTSIRNDAPRGLSVYVAGRDSVLRTYLETFVPGEAEIRAVVANGEPVEFRAERQAGRLSVAVYLEVGRGETGEVIVSYELPPPDGRFELIVDPQPLPTDAELNVRILLPYNWDARGSGSLEDRILSFEGELDRRHTFVAYPDRRTGIPGMWQAVKNFWSRPLF